ncbi:PRC-barrel domain-containing protein [Methanobrevibacter sp. OttesenSCG-928-I08]|nr:PRC-barrel domain-containing protein [Methanobrevibacter sp. OttesenSCG-928-I08]
MVSLKKIYGMTVIDHKGQDIGKIKKIDFDEVNGKINLFVIELHKGYFSHEKIDVTFDKIQGISDNVVLNIGIDINE